MTEKKPNKPVNKYRFGGVTVTVWNNETQAHGSLKSATIEKSYKNEKDEWEVSQTFFGKDLMYLRSAIDAVIRDHVIRVEE